MAKEQIGIYIDEMTAEGQGFPNPSNGNNLKLNENDFIVMIEYSSIKYIQEHYKKAVKKTLTIPEWLNIIAEDNNINFSNLLQNAIIKELNINKKF